MTRFPLVEEGPHLSPSTVLSFDARQLGGRIRHVGDIEDGAQKEGAAQRLESVSTEHSCSSLKPCTASLTFGSCSATENQEVLGICRELNDVARDLPRRQPESQQAAENWQTCKLQHAESRDADVEESDAHLMATLALQGSASKPSHEEANAAQVHGTHSADVKQTTAELQREVSVLRAEHQEACSTIGELNRKLNMLRFRADMEREAAAQEILELDRKCKWLRSLLNAERQNASRRESANVALMQYGLSPRNSWHRDSAGKPRRHQPEMEHGVRETMVHNVRRAKSELATAEAVNARATASQGSCEWLQQPDVDSSGHRPAIGMANLPEANGESWWEMFVSSFGCCHKWTQRPATHCQ